jgi:N-acetyl-gamma-glutamylphosphate reductase
MTVPVFLFGARGMLAGELLRLMESHPGLELAAAASREAGAELHRNLARPLVAVDPAVATGELARTLERGELAAVVLALPHGESARTWTALAAELGSPTELVVVDPPPTSACATETPRGAHRHGIPRPPSRALPLQSARALPCGAARRMRRIAAPGCFATALQLAVVRGRAAPRSVAPVRGTASRTSGGGNEPKPGTHHPHHDNLWAYSVGGPPPRGGAHLALAKLDSSRRSTSSPLRAVRARHPSHGEPAARRGDRRARARAIIARRYAGEPFVEVLEACPTCAGRRLEPRRARRRRARRDAARAPTLLGNPVKGGAGPALQCSPGFPRDAFRSRAGLG